MKRLVITGASGFLGGHLTKLASNHFDTLGFFATYPFNLKGVKAQRIDLASPASILAAFEQFKPAIVIHNAALADPDLCEKHPELAHQINVIATERIANWCYKNNTRLIYTSTDMVFDGKKGNYTENDQPDPLSVYGKSKYSAEQCAMVLNPNTVIARLALMYGRGVFPRAFSSEWLERELRRRINHPDLPLLALYSDQYRSMLAVTNAARVLIELTESDFLGILHIGGPERISRYIFGEKLCRKLNLPVMSIKASQTSEHQLQAPRPLDVSFNITFAKSLLKTTLLPVDAGLDETLLTPKNFNEVV